MLISLYWINSHKYAIAPYYNIWYAKYYTVFILFIETNLTTFYINVKNSTIVLLKNTFIK